MKRPRHILLVEDNEGDVEMTERAIRNYDASCEISIANDGIEALDFLHRRGPFAGASTPHLILLDVNMPRMDGKQFLEIVKQDATLRNIPVVMLTSSESPTDILQCYHLQASFYVVKPFDGHEFAEMVKQLVQFWSRLARLPYEPIAH